MRRDYVTMALLERRVHGIIYSGTTGWISPQRHWELRYSVTAAALSRFTTPVHVLVRLRGDKSRGEMKSDASSRAVFTT